MVTEPDEVVIEMDRNVQLRRSLQRFDDSHGVPTSVVSMGDAVSPRGGFGKLNRSVEWSFRL